MAESWNSVLADLSENQEKLAIVRRLLLGGDQSSPAGPSAAVEGVGSPLHGYTWGGAAQVGPGPACSAPSLLGSYKHAVELGNVAPLGNESREGAPCLLFPPNKLAPQMGSAQVGLFPSPGLKKAFATDQGSRPVQWPRGPGAPLGPGGSLSGGVPWGSAPQSSRSERPWFLQPQFPQNASPSQRVAQTSEDGALKGQNLPTQQLNPGQTPVQVPRIGGSNNTVQASSWKDTKPQIAKVFSWAGLPNDGGLPCPQRKWSPELLNGKPLDTYENCISAFKILVSESEDKRLRKYAGTPNVMALITPNLDVSLIEFLLSKHLIPSRKVLEDRLGDISRVLQAIQWKLADPVGPAFEMCQSYELEEKQGILPELSKEDLLFRLSASIMALRRVILMNGQTHAWLTNYRAQLVLKACGLDGIAPKPEEFPNLKNSDLFGPDYLAACVKAVEKVDNLPSVINEQRRLKRRASSESPSSVAENRTWAIPVMW
nr:PREDICTED: uncharacterized protein LOC102359790 isoform X2 [Latimeria chalumnae]|eukprot:XP_006005915.1 PREDICTED: uncharacterized protein LOC102359790 isoform X2 [Latimeria chalumnae]